MPEKPPDASEISIPHSVDPNAPSNQPDMNEREYDVRLSDPTTGEQHDMDDITPGEAMPDELHGDPDPAFDYESASETWVGERAETEITIERLDTGSSKRFVLKEPDEQATGELISAAMDGDRFAFVSVLVDRPALTSERWRGSLTGRERTLLYDHSYAWVRLGDFVTVANLLDE